MRNDSRCRSKYLTHRREEKGGGWGELDMITKNPSFKTANKMITTKNDVTGSLQSDIQHVAELIAGYPFNFKSVHNI